MFYLVNIWSEDIIDPIRSEWSEQAIALFRNKKEAQEYQKYMSDKNTNPNTKYTLSTYDIEFEPKIT